MAIEHILGLVVFSVIVMALALLLPRRTRPSGRTDGGGEGGGSSSWFADGGSDCGGDGGGGD